MKPIKVFLTQDRPDDEFFSTNLYGEMPTNKGSEKYPYFVGSHEFFHVDYGDIKLTPNCIECVVITKEEYERLKQNDNRRKN